MLTHSPSAADGSHYYTEGRYYDEDGHAPAEWSGEGAKVLHREGSILDFQEFDRGLVGTLPDGTRLPDPPGGKERRHGDDWTFSPPKSVSLVALVGRDERVVAAHDRAVREAVRYMEREIFGTRGMVDGGQAHVPGGAVVGLFRHETSRPVDGVVDPQLHTHTVWLNAALRDDGEWRAADWDLAEGARYTANSVYLSELAADLRRCGYTLVATRDGYEVRGIPRKALEEFGRRAGQIERELAKVGKTRETASQPERQKANLRTREGKERQAKEVQRTEWDQRARTLGIDIGRFVGEARSREEVGALAHERDRPENAAVAVESAARHLSERSALFTHREVAAQALKAGLARGVVLEDLDPAVHRSATLVAAEDGRFATRETLGQEAHILDIVGRGRAGHPPIMAQRDVTTLIERQGALHGLKFTKGQSQAVRHVLTSPDLVTVVEGRAGTGKTLALDTVREGLERVGHHPLGLAPSAAATRRLAEGARVESHTIASWLETRGAGPRVYLVDEAGLVSTKDMATLLDRAAAEGSRVVLIGDPRQLHSVEAGNPLSAIVREGTPTVQLDEIQRQRDLDLKAVVEAFATGQAARGMDLASKAFRPSTDLAHAAAQDFLGRSPEEREGTLVLSGTNATREAINRDVRDGLRREGRLGEDLEVRTIRRETWTKEEVRQVQNYEAGQVVVPWNDYMERGVSSPLRRGEEYRVVEAKDGRVELEGRRSGERIAWDPAVASRVNVYREERIQLAQGDRVIFRENSRELGVVNGERGTVTRTEEGEYTVRLDRGDKDLTLDAESGARLEHAYATTVHLAQGQTVDHVVIAGETGKLASAEQAYVSYSRARESATVYTDEPEKLKEAWEEWRGKANALDHVEMKEWAQSHLGQEAGVHRGPETAPGPMTRHQQMEMGM
jgi:conjugative relaxase-like TrwC/TraI family protein